MVVPDAAIPRRDPVQAGLTDDLAPADAHLFRYCSACHLLTVARDGIGPSLKGIYGKPAARNPRYQYSLALREANLVWDASTLDRFLANPRAHVPGNKMSFAGLKDPATRAQIIALMERSAD